MGLACADRAEHGRLLEPVGQRCSVAGAERDDVAVDIVCIGDAPGGLDDTEVAFVSGAGQL